MSKTAGPPKRFNLVGEALRFRLPQVAVDATIEQFFESLDTPVSLSCAILYRAGEFSQLVSKEINPLDYNSADRFRDDFAAISFLRKSEFLKTGFDTREEALRTFRDAELQCRNTNRRFDRLDQDPLFNGSCASLLHVMTRKISRILGDFSAEEFLSSGAFGPGASTSITGCDTSTVRKFQEERQISHALYQFVEPLLPLAYPLWFRDGKLASVEFREFSKVITVPKNAKTDRTIAVEPGLNIWFQKALGSMIRSRLCRNGLNLDGSKFGYSFNTSENLRHYRSRWLQSSSDRNSVLARIGSTDSSLSTVDFSAASDTISKSMVREVLPSRWHLLLDLCRSRHYKLQDEIHTFEKFSSMGNGFTFELETLLFYTAALACCESVGADQSKVSVFGDDVVIPSEAYSLFVEFSRFLGFTVNGRKSYSSGYFRESCGSYWFDGIDVKPFFFKRYPSSAFKAFSLANSILTIAHRNSYGLDGRFEAVWNHLISRIPKKLRIFGEKSGGSGCIWSNFDLAHPSKLRDHHEGYSFRCFTFPAAMLETDSPALLVSRLYTSSDGLGNTYPIRTVVKTRFCRVSVQQWYDFGPWLSGAR